MEACYRHPDRETGVTQVLPAFDDRRALQVAITDGGSDGRRSGFGLFAQTAHAARGTLITGG
jgi:hypothetical protein